MSISVLLTSEFQGVTFIESVKDPVQTKNPVFAP